jgi:predicted ATPase/DNA-binding SARP family transcriptional activator
MDARCRIELLGWLRARQEDRLITRFETHQTGALLAYLAYHRQRSHPRDVLIEVLWPEADPERARHNLRKALSSLRHQLEPPGVPPGTVIRADRTTVQLNPDAVSTDVAEFEAALQAAGRARSGAERAQRLAEAVALYQGELLPGYFEDWVLPEQQRLAEAYREALAQLVRHCEEERDLPRALDYARRMVAADPLREEAQCELIRLLGAAGRPDAARRQYEELERLLAQELDAEPAAETRALLREVERRAQRTQSPTPSRPHSIDASRMPAGTLTFLMAEVGTAAEVGAASAEEGMPAGWLARLARLIEQRGGHVVKSAGHSLLAVFQRASDALAAAEAGMEQVSRISYSVSDGQMPDTQHAICNTPRMALHTGEVEREASEYRGLAVDHTVRLLLAAHPGQLLCSEATAALLRGEQEPGKPGPPLADLGVYRLRDAGDVAVRERLFQVISPGMPQREFPPPRGALPLAGHLPLRLTRFFGREAEIARLCEMLLGERMSDLGGGTSGSGSPVDSGPIQNPKSKIQNRLVTLTGPGGSGKTRLALEVAERLVEPFGGAVWFVPLADLADARLIADAARDALRLPRSPGREPLEQLVETLSRQPSLLLLDNFEHLIEEGAALVRTLLERVPVLTLLVTSRQSLGVEGEQEFPVAPLPVPGEGVGCRVWGVGSDKVAPAGPYTLHPTPDALLHFPGVRLFVDRAQAARPAFQLTAANAEAIAALCAKLEGLPLAIELAAARAGTLTPHQMLEQIEHRFQFLVSKKQRVIARHRSVWAALDWSYQLLSPELQHFFARLSVFRGGCTLEAAEAVCGEGCRVKGVGCRVKPPDPTPYTLHPTPCLGCLERLRECSLIAAAEDGGEMRYRLLETLREYAAEQLVAEEAAVMARRHAQYYLALAEEAEPQLTGPGQPEWLDRLDRERANLDEALRWSARSGNAELGTRLGAALGEFWRTRGSLAAGRECLAEVLGLAPAERTPARARALDGAAMLAHYQGDFAAARSFLEESLATARAVGDRPGVATALASLGLVLRVQGDYEAAASVLEESLAVSRELGDQRRVGVALGLLGDVALHQGQLAAARSLYQESLAPRQEVGDKRRIAYHFNNMGDVTCAQGEYQPARALYEKGLKGCGEVGDVPGIAWSLYGLSSVAFHQGEHAAARSLCAESLARRRQLGDKRGIAECLERLAEVGAAQGRPRRAAGLFGAAAALRATIGAPLPPASRAAYDHHVAALREKLGEAGFAAAWVEGRAMSLERAVAEALEGVPEPGSGSGN